MTLRLELFVGDVAASLAFYTNVLRFEVAREDGLYIALERGDAQVALNSWDELAPSHHFRRGEPHSLLGAGVEIVLEVDDIDAEYSRVVATGISFNRLLEERPWGLRDFRVTDPDGYYVRVTARRA